MRIAQKPKGLAKPNRFARPAIQVSLGLVLAGIIAMMAFVERTGQGVRDSAVRKMSMRVPSAQPPITAGAQPPRAGGRKGKAQQQALQVQAAREEQMLRELQMRQRLEQQQLLRQRGALPAQAFFLPQQWNDGQLERSVFQQYGTASGARRRLDMELTMGIIEIERACKLTDSQKQKLRLAGRGDIKRFFDRYEDVKQKAEASEQDEQKGQEIWQDINSLQTTLMAGIFGEHSLLIKSLPNTLTREQFTRYDVRSRERRAERHRECAERALATLKRAFEITVARLERNIVLREEQREKLLALMIHETKPSPKAGPYDTQVILVQLGRLPEEKLKRLFDEDQWPIMSQQLAGYQQLEPMLKQAGLMPGADDGADSSDERPGPENK